MTLLGKIFNAIHDDESAEISSIDEKLSPSINDLLLIEDSEDGNNKKSVLIGNLPTGGGDYSGFGEVFVNLFSGSETTDENNWKSIGASEIDTAKFGFDGYFEAVLSSSDDAGASELRLFNLTTNAQIGDILEVNGEVSFVSEQITLTGGVNIYEAQLRSPDGYYAVCKNARVSFYKFILNAPDASEDGYVAIAQSGDLVYVGGETDGYVLTWNAGLNSWEPQEPTGSGGGGTLAETLALGNTTGSNDIIVSIGDVIIGGGTIVASTPGDVVTPGALTLGIAAGSGFDDGSLTLDGDGGLVQITAGEGYGLGDGGSVDISAGSANGADSDGGDIYLTSGLGIGTGRGGNVQCYVMPSDGSGDGGEFQVYIGQDPEDLAFKVDAQGDGYFYNNLEIDGKLTVSGLIDPTGLVLSEQLSVPGGIPSTGNYTLWVRDDGYALLTNSNGETTTLSGGEGILQNLSDVLSIGNSANSQLISDLLDPINAQDAATKNYIDGYVGGLGGDLSGSLPNPEVTDLTITGEEQGSVLYFDGTNWTQLPPNTNGYVLTTHGTGADPTWEQSTASGGSLGEVFVNLFTGNKTINDGYWVAVGGAEIDTSDFNIDGYFEAVLSSSNPAGAAHLRLFNVTTNSQIGDILEVYDSIAYISEPVTLTSGSNIYEVQLRSPDGYWVVCYNARISFSKYALTPPINTEDGYVAIAQSGDLIYIGGETDGYVLTWNSGLNTWEPQTPTINVVGEEQGSVLYFDGSNWVQLPPGDDGYTLTTHGTGTNPTWTIAGNDTYAIHDNVPGEISTITEKATPAATDLLIIEDSADSNNKKRIQISSIFSIPGLSGMMNDAFVATENQTDFTLSQSPSNDVAIMVVDGITQSSLDYTVSGTGITYSGLALSAGQAVDFWYSLGTGSGSGGSGVQFISILSGIETHDLDGWKTVGIVEINSTEFTGTTSLEVVLYTSDGYADGYARLYNTTTLAQIGALTTTNNLPTLLSTAITLTSGSNLYELQIRVEQDGTGEFVSCGMGRIKTTGGGSGTVGETWISPDALDADVNDWNPTGFSTATIIRVDAVDDGYSITGFDASATAIKKEVINVSAYDVIIANQDVGSVATNRIISQIGGLILAADDSMTIVYDPVTERWRVI
jgi:hypothetical protein